MNSTTMDRRPIKARSLGSIQNLAATMARVGVTPNQVSLLSIAFSGLGSACMASAGITPVPFKGIVFMTGAFFIQMRLLCNLLDGLIAVEGGKKTKLGELYNEMPDRVSDTALLVSAGYCASNPELGWAAALAAMSTAYVRAFAAQSTGKQDFRGPMAKQHRMFFLTLALIAMAFFQGSAQAPAIMTGTLAIITAGSVLTAVRRTLTYARFLESR